jgi:hypothetical protein
MLDTECRIFPQVNSLPISSQSIELVHNSGHLPFLYLVLGLGTVYIVWSQKSRLPIWERNPKQDAG